MKDKIKKWYEKGLWTETLVRQAVEKVVLTAQEAGAIWGEVGENG